MKGRQPMQNTVAVTGADGFIGSHLVEALVDRGHRVRAMVQYNSFASRGWLDDVAPDVMEQVEAVPGDVRDPASVRGLVRGAQTVYHLAALIAIPYSYRAPRSYVDTNVTGTLNVLEAVRDEETPRLVHTSTSETYGTARRVPIDESHPLQAQSPYAATKIAADRLVESYHASFGLPAVTLRPFNTFGPRQSARAFIPTVAGQIAAGSGTVEVGALEPTRDFTFVRDTAEAFVALGTAPAVDVVGGTFNSGTGVEISMGRLARAIADLMGADPEFRCAADRERPAASEVMRLVCDAGRLRRVTGWRHRHTLEEGLKQTVEWFLDPANLARYRPSTYTI
jgi:NAD dependent epimerase/dehydratase